MHAILAWALIGEWTSRILFPVPKGPWPRHGHAGALLKEYQARSPRIVAWARASFEQGALPSLLFLQGLVPIFTLPGDRMFQATGLGSNRQRPPIMHAYGGAKSGMAQALQSIASEGWIPLAAAMVGTVGKQPLWADLGLRPVVGTTMDIKLWPRPLQHRDVVLLLSCWKRWDHGSISESAINTWLKGVNMAYGPDCEDSPRFRRSNIDELEAMRLFGECGFDFLPETDLQQRPGLDVVMTVGVPLSLLTNSWTPWPALLLLGCYLNSFRLSTGYSLSRSPSSLRKLWSVPPVVNGMRCEKFFSQSTLPR